jgi:hypothetical protein
VDDGVEVWYGLERAVTQLVAMVRGLDEGLHHLLSPRDLCLVQ